MFSREFLEGLSYRARSSNGRWRLTNRDLTSVLSLKYGNKSELH